ncbi:hypothetical protein Cni_G28376 [Canna indica]|uniref:Uncharacterized protein n=1 Tax=Canna indica TaxID=4628 RepID=A0AAQ3QQ78_9LILI|nr:hypothetical protein Cni_G28376 [Canna indica]
MGATGSRQAAAAAQWTAKVFLPDGEFREFFPPVTAAGVLGSDAARFFLCDADEMDFDGFVSAMGAGEGLLPGQIYFVLPRSMLKRALRAEDLAALAMKASAALVATGGRAVGPLVFSERADDRVGAVEDRTKRRRSSTKAGGAGGGRRFVTNLSVIAE